MRRTCTALADYGMKVLLVGRELENSPELQDQKYDQHRVRCWFNAGVFFYLEIIIRYTVLLSKFKFDQLLCVDLDTILMSKLIRKGGRRFVLDLHEYFEEVPELNSSPLKKMIWRRIGNWSVKRFDYCYTVNETLSKIFAKKYGKQFNYLLNLPNVTDSGERTIATPLKTVYLGVLNPGRGLEILIDVISRRNDAELVIIGNGPLVKELKERSNQSSNIHFTGLLSPEQITIELKGAHLGWNILDDCSKSYFYSLSNKFFDYVNRSLPVVTMDFPEYSRLVKKYGCGLLLESYDHQSVSKALDALTKQSEYWKNLVKGCQRIQSDFRWDTEKKKLIEFFDIQSSNKPL